MVKKALCIDDDEVALMIAKILLEETARVKEIALAPGALQALAYFDALEQNDGVPEVIFLDLNMPEMDGWQFLDEFEKKYSTRYPDIYIAILTSSVDPKDQHRADNHNLVNKFVSKPLTEEALDEIFKELQKVR